MAPDGPINFAPMGVEWGDDDDRAQAVSRDHHVRNVHGTRGVAVVNLTDDVDAVRSGRHFESAVSLGAGGGRARRGARGRLLLARARGRVASTTTPPRSRIVTRVVHHGLRREFLGFNRARHAVLEAAILATRTHLIPPEQIRDEFARLQVIVDKTAGSARAGGDGHAHRVCTARAVASSSRRRPDSISACSTFAARSGDGSAASAPRCPRRRFCSRRAG